MGLHRAFLDARAIGDLLVEEAFREQGEYAGLLFGEAGQAAGEVGVGGGGRQGGDGIGEGRRRSAGSSSC